MRGALLYKKHKEMEKRDITICGKTVTVAYCFATEIAFRNYASVAINDLDTTNPEHLAYIILSAITTYYQSENIDPPVTDKELLYNSRPEELIAAIKTIVEMQGKWYKSPIADTKEDEKDEAAEKNS